MTRTAVAYFRTSSAANVGEDKDSDKRQRAAVTAYAKRHRLRIVREFYDAAVSGADDIETRPGFVDLLTYCLGNGARTVIVESADRFARDNMVQELGYRLLKSRGIELIAANHPECFTAEGPMADFIRQLVGLLNQLIKAMIVERLRAARDRKSVEKGRRIEGHDHIADEVIARAIAIKKADRRASLRDIARQLAEEKHTTRNGTPFSTSTVARWLRNSRNTSRK